MIARSIILAIAMIGAYAWYVGRNELNPMSDNLWQENSVKAEKFIYNRGMGCTNVLVGTSLSNDLIFDKDKNICLLTLPGRNVIDGLEVLNKSNLFPSCVFIEINSVLLGRNSDFVDFLFPRLDFGIKQRVTIFREGYQPLTRISSRLKPFFSRLGLYLSSWFLNPVLRVFGVRQRQIVDEHYFKKLFRRFDTIDEDLIKSRFEFLRSEVNRLQAGGSKIYFYEVPVSKPIQATKVFSRIDESRRNYFPVAQYPVFKSNSFIGYKTTDGLHLNDAAAKQFSKELLLQIEGFLAK